MRVQTLWIGIALMLSLIIGTQLTAAHINANVVPAKVDIWPHWVCIRDNYCAYDCNDNAESFSECESACECGWTCSCGGWITAFIRLPKKYDVGDIDPSTVTLQVVGGNVSMSAYRVFWRKIFIAVFDRAAVIDLLCPMIEHMAPHAKQEVTLVVTGNLYDGKIFRGEDRIAVFLLNH